MWRRGDNNRKTQTQQFVSWSRGDIIFFSSDCTYFSKAVTAGCLRRGWYLSGTLSGTSSRPRQNRNMKQRVGFDDLSPSPRSALPPSLGPALSLPFLCAPPPPFFLSFLFFLSGQSPHAWMLLLLLLLRMCLKLQYVSHARQRGKSKHGTHLPPPLPTTHPHPHHPTLTAESFFFSTCRRCSEPHFCLSLCVGARVC